MVEIRSQDLLAVYNEDNECNQGTNCNSESRKEGYSYDWSPSRPAPAPRAKMTQHMEDHRKKRIQCPRPMHRNRRGKGCSLQFIPNRQFQSIRAQKRMPALQKDKNCKQSIVEHEKFLTTGKNHPQASRRMTWTEESTKNQSGRKREVHSTPRRLSSSLIVPAQRKIAWSRQIGWSGATSDDRAPHPELQPEEGREKRNPASKEQTMQELIEVVKSSRIKNQDFNINRKRIKAHCAKLWRRKDGDQLDSRDARADLAAGIIQI
ncbi:hypothetical protein R1flu_007153 [Riccia fluitans]|uniref:Uncharacterized protein n=1 Tax=Riccia fluitans TaxID=41844 RepID=A0ABD1YY27_9MARC